MYGGVKPWVARAGQEIAGKFGVTSVLGKGPRTSNPTSDHPKRLALDFMVSTGVAKGAQKSKGDKIAAYAVKNRKRLGITYIIWFGRIFHTYGEWGSYHHPSGATDANSMHMNHVHCSFVTKDPGMGGATSSGGNTGGSNHYNAITGTWGDGSSGTSGSTGSHTGGKSNRAVVKGVAKHYGWNTGAQWADLVALVNSESHFNNSAQNPTSTAYGMFQFLDATWKNYGFKKTSDPHQQAVAGLTYIKSRYGDPAKAWSYHKKHGSYDKGAWEIKADEDARVHKGEMLIPAREADQIREVLMNGNAYGATARGRKGGGGVVIEFKPGSIVVHAGAGVSKGQGRALGKDIADAISQDKRIKALQEGRYSG